MSKLGDSLREASQLAADAAVRALKDPNHMNAAVGAQLLSAAAAGATAAEEADRKAVEKPKG
jgi:hypothetical protein